MTDNQNNLIIGGEIRSVLDLKTIFSTKEEWDRFAQIIVQYPWETKYTEERDENSPFKVGNLSHQEQKCQTEMFPFELNARIECFRHRLVAGILPIVDCLTTEKREILDRGIIAFGQCLDTIKCMDTSATVPLPFDLSIKHREEVRNKQLLNYEVQLPHNMHLRQFKAYYDNPEQYDHHNNEVIIAEIPTIHVSDNEEELDYSQVTLNQPLDLST